MILMTDGTQTKTPGAEDPGDISEEIRNTGVRTIVIGIGKASIYRPVNKLKNGVIAKKAEF